MMSFAPRAGWSAWFFAGVLGASAAVPCGTAMAADAALGRGPGAAQAHVRLGGAIDDNDRVTLSGNRHPRLSKAEDHGRADDARVVRRMILTLQPDAQQQTALEAFMASRRDPSSPFYGQWLSPAEFEQQFGVAEADVAKVVNWLQDQGFTVDEIPQGRRSIVFSGAVRHIRKAFRTDMRHYRVGQEDHLANTDDPSIPDALSAVVNGVVSLHDFRSRPALSSRRPAPAFNDGSGGHALAAADFATIYNTKTLLTQGNDGTGATIAVLGRTDVVLGDMSQFRTVMGLPANPPVVIYNGGNPGRQSGDEGESDLDLQWAGAVAPGATIKFVTSPSTTSTDGIDLSAQYAVSNNVADIITLSYGLCEADLGTSATNFYNGLWQQAAAQGQSVFVSSGDSGAADCDAGTATTATRGRAVNGLCTSPYSTCVGGTQFDDTANPSQYWAASNASNLSSALSYIPEKVWNESGTVSGGSGLWASGGGASTVFTQPSWQTGVGVPSNGRRNVPDVSLTAASHDGYLVYSSDNSTSTRTRYVFGGTSASAPSFAGLMALVKQKTGTRQGNANPRFYELAALQVNGGPAYFHAVQGGNNSVPGVTGFTATPGAVTPVYNQATGLGSVNADVMVNQWAATLPASTTSLTAAPSSTAYSQSVTFSATVARGVSGGSAPTGTVQFKDGTGNLGSPVALSSGTATYSTSSLGTGNHSITAVYSGDSANAASTSASLSYDVAQVASTVSVSSSVSSTLVGQSVTFTASLTGKSVSGSLQFKDGNTVLATMPLVSCPTTFSTSALGVGVHQISVVYSGDVNNTASTSAALTHSVMAPQAITTSALSTSASSVVVGQSINLSVTVTGDGINVPTGTVQFMDGAAALGSPVALSNGAASLASNTLTVGTHALTAVYSGDAANAASTSAAVTVVVTQASTSVALASTQTTSTEGQSVSFTATIGGVSPTGTVTFMDGSASLGVVNLSTAQATLTTATLAVGTHTITAIYSGDANNAASTSAAFVHTVTAATPVADDSGDTPTLPEWAFLLTALLLLGSLVRRQRRA